jgi:hypothetical protein
MALDLTLTCQLLEGKEAKKTRMKLTLYGLPSHWKKPGWSARLKAEVKEIYIRETTAVIEPEIYEPAMQVAFGAKDGCPFYNIKLNIPSMMEHCNKSTTKTHTWSFTC